MSTARLAAAALSLVLCVASTQAAAQPRVDREARGRQHFAEGQQLASEGEFEAAYAEFAAGYALTERPLFQFNMGECARSSGDDERARRHYTHYLEVDPDGSMATIARERMQALGGHPPDQRAGSADGAQSEVWSVPTPTEAAASADPPATEVVAQDGEVEPFYETWPFWLAVGTVVIAAAATGILMLSNRGSDSACGEDCAGEPSGLRAGLSWD